ncbi:hypothetical protein JYU19_02565 [bacterium AH-315-J21]|nr:hypothetical protein [bacterium AH-315-J21]
MKISNWFTLFFIPIFPYSTKRLLVCPVCKVSFELESEQYDEMRPIAEANQRLVDGKISNQEHQSLLFENRKKIE